MTAGGFDFAEHILVGSKERTLQIGEQCLKHFGLCVTRQRRLHGIESEGDQDGLT